MEALMPFDQGYEGFASANAETLAYLTKALSAGAGVDAGAFTGGRALIPESLDATLVNVLHNQDEARLFQRLKKQPVQSPVHQWDERTEVGADDGAWVPEGGDSEEADQTIARRFVTMKYLQTLRKATLQASISNMIEDAVALEQNAGTLWLIRNVERILFNGRNDIVAEEPDGLERQIVGADQNIDLRGADATSAAFEDAITQGTRVIRDNFGKASHLFTSTKVMEDVQKLLRDRIRWDGGMQQYGNAIYKEYPTPFGSPDLVDDVFLNEKGVPKPSALTTKRPDAPSITAAAAADATAKFQGAAAGTYQYTVSAINRFGQSAESNAVTQAVLGTERVDLTVTAGSIVGTGYVVFRSKVGVTGGRLEAFRVPFTGGVQVVADRNNDLPGTSSTYLLTMDTVYNAIEWVQFLPMMKFNLYPTNAAVYPFLMLLFGALAVKKPRQMVRIKNVSPSALGFF